MNSVGTKGRLVAVVLLSIVALIGGIACGGGGDSNEETAGAVGEEGGVNAQAGLQRAERIAKEFMAPVTTWAGPTESPPPVEDKFIVMIPCIVSAPGCMRQVLGAQEAAKVLGWRTQVIDGRAQPRAYVQAIEQAISLEPDGIFLVAVPVELVGPAVARARERGIEVVGFGLNPDEKPSPEGVTAEVGLPWGPAGEAVGNWLVWHTNGEGKFVVLHTREFAAIREFIDRIKASMDENCPNCEILAETNVNFADVGTTVGPTGLALLQANPEAEVLIGASDPVINPVMAAVRGTQFGDSVKFSGLNGDPPNLTIIRENGPQIIDVALPYRWGGWAAMDTFNRIFNGERDFPDCICYIPARIFTVSNQDDIPEGGYWEGDYPYEDEYKKLWGLE